MLKWILSFSALFILSTLTGCSNDYKPTLSREAKFFAPVYQPVTSRVAIATSNQGRDIECIIHGFGDDTVLFIASIHGDEVAGTSLLASLDSYLKEHPEFLVGKQVVMIPIANPDGFVAKSRFNADGVDINRNFPAENRVNNKVNGFTSLSEPESRAIDSVIRIYKPNRIITFHQPLDCIDYDGPAQELAQLLSKTCKLNVKKLGARAGSLGAYAGEDLGIKVITVELPEEAKHLSQTQLWQQYAKLIFTAINGH